MKKHITSIFFLCLLSVSQLIAQSHSIKRLGIEQGLSNNYVISIAQDKQGFLWFEFRNISVSIQKNFTKL